jgi:hypothetical protein
MDKNIIYNSLLASGIFFVGAVSTALTEHGLDFEKLELPLILAFVAGLGVFLTGLQQSKNPVEPVSKLTKDKRGGIRLFQFVKWNS